MGLVWRYNAKLHHICIPQPNFLSAPFHLDNLQHYKWEIFERLFCYVQHLWLKSFPDTWLSLYVWTSNISLIPMLSLTIQHILYYIYIYVILYIYSAFRNIFPFPYHFQQVHLFWLWQEPRENTLRLIYQNLVKTSMAPFFSYF